MLSLKNLGISKTNSKNFNLDSVSIQAWKILFLLLVDEDELVRKSAAQIVNDIAKSCDVAATGNGTFFKNFYQNYYYYFFLFSFRDNSISNFFLDCIKHNKRYKDALLGIGLKHYSS